FNHEPVQVASHGTYIGILSQATVAQIQQPKVYYFITDHLGTPMKMTDESGAVVWSADHRPFGELSVSNATVANKFRFPGQYYDSETGLHSITTAIIRRRREGI
ncbi:MAG: RHS domain-containing protein, partial [Desulfobacterales bacterium]|nr:RHS domain-containing protein [Desulfobacterales bacterium]